MANEKVVSDILGLGPAAEKAIDLAGDFTKRIFGPLADEVGQALADPVRDWHKRRSERAQSIIEDAATHVQQSGSSALAVPGRILWPILEAGSLEENGDLRLRWSALLAKAAIDPSGIPPAFPQLLASLSPLEVGILDARFAQPEEEASEHRAVASFVRDVVPDGIQPAHLAIALTNLIRLGLVSMNLMPEDVDLHQPEDLQDQTIRLTSFARAFIRACSVP